MGASFLLMHIPVIFAADFTALTAYYRNVLKFGLRQQVPGVVSLLERGPLKLQVWPRRDPLPRDCRIELEGPTGLIFQVHAMLAREARSAMVDGGPALRRWGAWEFEMCDPEGNRLIFTEWACDPAHA